MMLAKEKSNEIVTKVQAPEEEKSDKMKVNLNKDKIISNDINAEIKLMRKRGYSPDQFKEWLDNSSITIEQISLPNRKLLKEMGLDIEKKESEVKKKEITLKDLSGVGPATIEKLESVGYTDLMSVAVATPGELIEATGMGDAAAKKLIAQARSNLDMGFESG